MFKALFGSVLGKITSLALLLAGVAGGMALTGDVPNLVAFESEPVMIDPALASPPVVALDFPTSILAKPAPAPVPEAVPAITEVIVEAAPPATAAAPPPAPPKCVGQLAGLVNGLLTTVQTITSPQQAQAVLAEAGSIGEASKGCAAEAAAAGNMGLDQVGKLTEQLAGIVGQIQALPVLNQPASGTTTSNPVGAVTGLVTTGLEETLGVVNKGLGILFSPLH